MEQPQPTLIPVSPGSLDGVEEFLRLADLTVAGLDVAALWMVLDGEGRIVGTTGFELAGEHALIRSVAVRPDQRSSGLGSRLATFAVDAAAARGASIAWLFSRRSGPFWQQLGFGPASTADLAVALADTAQVKLFTETGQLAREVAWNLALSPPPSRARAARRTGSPDSAPAPARWPAGSPPRPRSR